MALQVGELLSDRYKITRVIRSGGMGSVFEAEDEKLASARCAVKEIHDAALKGSNSAYIQARFFEEMKALSALDHAAIPRVRDYMASEEAIFLVMDLVQGESLEEEMAESRAASTRPDPDAAASDMIQLLEVLDYLHSQSPPIIHRDIKPSNILRDRRTHSIKLVDFGLAKAMDSSPNTQTSVGTMGYCSPEQMMGRPGIRSDIYSVGVTLAHLLTLKMPQMSFVNARVITVPNARPGLSEIVARATQPSPDDRYATAREMANALRAWLAEGAESEVTALEKSAVLPRPSSRPALAAPSSLGAAGRWRTFAVGALAVLATSMGAALALSGSRPAPVAVVPVASPSPPPKPQPAMAAAQPIHKAPAHVAPPPAAPYHHHHASTHHVSHYRQPVRHHQAAPKHKKRKKHGIQLGPIHLF